MACMIFGVLCPSIASVALDICLVFGVASMAWPLVKQKSSVGVVEWNIETREGGAVESY